MLIISFLLGLAKVDRVIKWVRISLSCRKFAKKHAWVSLMPRTLKDDFAVNVVVVFSNYKRNFL